MHDNAYKKDLPQILSTHCTDLNRLIGFNVFLLHMHLCVFQSKRKNAKVRTWTE